MQYEPINLINSSSSGGSGFAVDLRMISHRIELRNCASLPFLEFWNLGRVATGAHVEMET